VRRFGTFQERRWHGSVALADPRNCSCRAHRARRAALDADLSGYPKEAPKSGPRLRR